MHRFTVRKMKIVSHTVDTANQQFKIQKTTVQNQKKFDVHRKS